jgi:hypothetical protein
MNPSIKNILENDDILTFTLANVNVSLANALRRTILSNIPTFVFKTTPYEENKAIIYENTSRLNNEIIKQRLSCIPIFIPVLDDSLNNLEKEKEKEKENHLSEGATIETLSNYLLELEVNNDSDIIMYATTEDFKIKNIKTNKYLPKEETQKIFPPNPLTQYFIDFVRLRPKISEKILGEKIHLTCLFSISTAKENGMYNVVSTCSYGNTIDKNAFDTELSKQRNKWKNEGKDVDFETKNWKLLEGLRLYEPNSFDFTIQTLGIYSNYELVYKACVILINKLMYLTKLIDSDELIISASESTMKNSYDIVLENEDYTIGKVIEYLYYAKYFEGEESLTFCGFKKIHPHDSNSIIRVAYKENIGDKILIKQNLKSCINDAIVIFENIKSKFV